VKELTVLEDHAKSKGLNLTNQRKKILEYFLKVEDHVSIEEFYNIVKKKDPDIGYSTVYRTLKLFSECELAREVDFGEGRVRYEHLFGHEHHDHLICEKCGLTVEFMDPDIEKLQEKLLKKHKFKPIDHKLELFGLCEKCQKNGKIKDDKRK
jgi:Fur family transcriptional regulator, ferric uptake regulator